ncbi:MAG: type III-A CRISPR-associated RAMP protein Csm3 [Bacteroidales bacterium]|nr:type III-A CRISPR-associated RAMP protein Csm3 [Bacteroidales bacterium]
MKQLEKKIFISATLNLLTGLHIGDNKESIEIGGVDNPVVRRKDNNEPYIPGSSLKGKMRCLLDQIYGVNPDGKCKSENYTNDAKIIADLFGASGDNGNPSRLIVRDAYLTEEWAEKLKNSEFTDMPYTEIKFENVINRVKGTAEHPRQIERVPAGAEFEVNFIINIFKDDKESDLLDLFYKGIQLLQDDYLGGSGSRGYGQVQIEIKERKEKLYKVQVNGQIEIEEKIINN